MRLWFNAPFGRCFEVFATQVVERYTGTRLEIVETSEPIQYPFDVLGTPHG